MAEGIVSEIKRDYIRRLVKEGKRPDGRGFEEYRPIEITTGVVSQAEGSAKVRLGDTLVYCGVKMQPGTPFPDQPNSGTLTTSAELIPMASPTFEPGPPKPEAIELSRVVDRGIRESKMVPVDKLCITPGEKVWVLYLDFHIVDYDGNLFDACSAAALAALLTTKVPAKKIGAGEDYPLPVDHYPVMTTAMKVGDRIVWDPGLVEDDVGEPRLSISTDENGDVRAMQKGLEGTFTRDEVLYICRTAPRKGRELREQVLKQLGLSLPPPAPTAPPVA